LFAADTGETEISTASLHPHPLVVLFFEMDVTFVQAAYDVEQLPCLDAHRSSLLDVRFGVAADRHVEVGAHDADRILAQAFDQYVREDGNRRFAFDDALDVTELFFQHALTDGEFHFVVSYS